MYKVFFESLCVYQSPSVEDAVAFALGLHKSSNVKHSVGVIEVGHLKPSIVFRSVSLEEDSKKDGD